MKNPKDFVKLFNLNVPNPLVDAVINVKIMKIFVK